MGGSHVVRLAHVGRQQLHRFRVGRRRRIPIMRTGSAPLQSVFIVFPVHDPIGFFARQTVDWRPTARSFAFGRHIEVELVLAGFDFPVKLRL